MSKYFTYNSGQLPAGHFRISPSQLSRFFDDTSNWYREMLLGEAPVFTHSTASELGTCVHAAAAMYFDNKSVDTQAIDAYIASIKNPDIDKAVISSQYPVMVNTLVNSFLSKTKGTHSEWFVHTEIQPGIVAAGSIDFYDSGIEYTCDDTAFQWLKTNNLV